MVTDKLKELEQARARIAELQDAVAADLRKELGSLPQKYGFESVAAFVKAVQAAAGKKRGRPAKAAAGAEPTKRRKRAVITDETREQVKKMVKDEKTGAEIAKALGISLPSVQNIKKALGLVQARKK